MSTKRALRCVFNIHAMDTGAKTRLNQAYDYLKFKKIIEKQQDVADRIGATRPNVAKALSGTEGVLTESFLKRFGSAFNDTISAEWLLTGKGQMLNDGSSQTIPATIELQAQTELNEKNAVKWYYELDASAGDGLFENNEINAPYKYINVPGFEGCFGLNVTGDSMLNTAQSGDIVAVYPQEVQTIINGEIYLVVTRDYQRMVKRLVASGYSEDAIITCISDNPDKTRYADMKIQADLIHKIFRVAGFVSIKRMA